MMTKKGILLIVLIFLLGNGVVKAQTYSELISNTLTGKDITLRLPPISELQSSAIENSPLLKIYNADVVISELKVKSAKREWMRSLGFEAGAKYGLFDNLIVTGDLGIDYVATNTTEQTRYNFGVFLKIPLSSVIDKSGVQLAKVELDKISYQREASISELRQLIIIQYNNIVKAYRTIVVQNNAVELYRVQMIRAEQDFNNGKITVAEYARLNDMLSRAVINLENAKVEYVTAIQLLEETVGVEINLLN
jgi:outer membrane protein TolC